MKTRLPVSIFAGVALVCLLILLAIRYTESLHAKRESVQAIQPNMTRSQVVDSLGVLYDGYKPGEYKTVDAVVLRMESSELIDYICC